MLNVVGELKEEVMMSSTARHSINIALWGEGAKSEKREVTFLESWKHIPLIVFICFMLRLLLYHSAALSITPSCFAAPQPRIARRHLIS